MGTSPTKPRPVGLAGRKATPCTFKRTQPGDQTWGVVLRPGRASARNQHQVRAIDSALGSLLRGRRGRRPAAQ